MSHRKIGKSLKDVSWFHSNFIEEEEQMFNRQMASEALYSKGPTRTRCILCSSPIGKLVCFSRKDVTYSVCENCEHLNGLNEISEDFIDFCYRNSEESENAELENKPYESEFSTGKMYNNYLEVVERIYQPKAKFLHESLLQDGVESVTDLRYLDFGCGSGHFLKSLRNESCVNIQGVDSLESAIRIASSFGLSGSVEVSKTEDYLNVLSKSDADVVTMMCVLPHLLEPVKALKAMKSAGVKWTFQKLPMWSFAVWLESAFPQFRSRVLGTDHTHVFTWKSLAWLEQEVGMKRLATWSFGSDALDLIRKIDGLQRNYASQDFIDWSRESLFGELDEFQYAIDKMGASSEIHIVWKLN